MSINKLSHAAAASAKEPGVHIDGAGLRLKITKAGSKSWIYRYRINGKDREMGLGAFNDINLAQARRARDNAKSLVALGKDPISARKATRAKAASDGVWTFKMCAEEFIKSRSKKWSATHTTQWENSLINYAYPVFKDIPVGDIDTDLVLRVLEPHWHEKSVTMSRVRNRIEKVLAWATFKQYRVGGNPARWSGHLEIPLTSPADHHVEHLAAIPYKEVGDLFGQLSRRDSGSPLNTRISSSSQALQLIILTATRSNEAAGARWDEVDFNRRTWTIPTSRMKKDVPHTVPLSDAAFELFERLYSNRRSQCQYVFPSRSKPRDSIGPKSILGTLRKLQSEITVHGFRSAFRDWVEEETETPAIVAEMALAHQVDSATVRAYRRTELVEKRRLLMQQWADYVTGNNQAEKSS